MDGIVVKARKVLDFYVDGFKNMTVGRKLWAIILIKVAILFLVFKLFFFPDILKENYDNDDDRARAVAEQLTSR
ncbi:MAG: DUF4492 domain-containing protein [Muribaculaceae bacterium]|nr:DUF4492 domain-containing protein [Muribaculaceae bacterium]